MRIEGIRLSCGVVRRSKCQLEMLRWRMKLCGFSQVARLSFDALCLRRCEREWIIMATRTNCDQHIFAFERGLRVGDCLLQLATSGNCVFRVCVCFAFYALCNNFDIPTLQTQPGSRSLRTCIYITKMHDFLHFVFFFDERENFRGKIKTFCHKKCVLWMGATKRKITFRIIRMCIVCCSMRCGYYVAHTMLHINTKRMRWTKNRT